MSLLGEDCAITINIGTRALNGNITFAGGASIHGIAKRVSIKSSVDLKDGKAMGDADKLFRATARESQIEIDSVVGTGGYYFCNSVSPVGLIGQVTFDELSSLSNAKVIEGVIEIWEGTAADGEIQMEKITIKGGVG